MASRQSEALGVIIAWAGIGIWFIALMVAWSMWRKRRGAALISLAGVALTVGVILLMIAVHGDLRDALYGLLCPSIMSVPSLLTWTAAPRRPTRGGFCPRCGYNLQANVSGTCPECGTPTPQSVQSTQKANIAQAADDLANKRVIDDEDRPRD